MRRRVERTGHLQLPRMGGNRLAKWWRSSVRGVRRVFMVASQAGPVVAERRAAQGAAMTCSRKRGVFPIQAQQETILHRLQRLQDFPRRSAVLRGPLAPSAQTAMYCSPPRVALAGRRERLRIPVEQPVQAR